MKNIVRNLSRVEERNEEGEGEEVAITRVPRTDQYLFIFLKFIQSVIPTIEYDFTMEVDAGSGGGR